MAQRSAANRPAAAPLAEAAVPVSGPVVTFDMIRDNPRVKVFIRKSDEALAEIGYTEHGERHVGLVAHIAYNMLKRLGYPEREAELAADRRLPARHRQRGESRPPRPDGRDHVACSF